MNPSKSRTIVVDRDIQQERKLEAEAFRTALSRRGTLVINLVSSPGAGKTSLLEATARYWKQKYRMAVLVGDIATARDAERLAPLVPVQQLTTGGACHLEIELVKRGLAALPDERFDFLFVENIGNLVCPASHDVGEHCRVVLISTTEGDDKPGKYPKMFRTSDAMVITKTDLLPYVPFSPEAAIEDARCIQDAITPLRLCALDNSGIDSWCQWLEEQRATKLTGLQTI